MSLSPIGSPALPLTRLREGSGGQAPAGQSPVPAADAGGGDFGSSLKGLIGAVDGSAAEANDAVAKMLDGTGDVHEAMIALQRADVMLQLTVQVRNKLVQAYQDVMRMAV
jgi:flagellar hook-basal body complex protein FliE